MKIQIIIPTWNRKEILKNCLESFNKQTIDSYEILVVVDGSTDGTEEMLRDEYPEVEMIIGDGTWWYTKSINQGFRYVLKNKNPELFLITNDDTEVRENYLESLLGSYTTIKKGSIVGSISITKSIPHKAITSGYIYKNRYLGLRKAYLKKFTEIDPKDIKDALLPSITLSGRGMLIPADTLKSIGLFDERFKQYHADEEYCFRARKNGYDVYISWDAHIYLYEKLTGRGTAFLKEPFFTYCTHYFNKTSRIYIPDKAIMCWKYYPKALWVGNMMLFLIISFLNYFIKQKI